MTLNELMDMYERLQSYDLRLCPRSITLLHNGKTCGVVRAERVCDMPPSRIFEVHKRVKLGGVPDLRRLYLIDGELFYFGRFSNPNVLTIDYKEGW